MKIKKTILSCLLMLGCVSASAQQPGAEPEYVFNPHWYVQVQPLGAQYTLGEVSFGDLLSYNAQLGVGYQFDENAKKIRVCKKCGAVLPETPYVKKR